MLRLLATRTQSQRIFSPSTIRQLSLVADRYPAPPESQNTPLLILHGLYGSRQNWRSLAKALHKNLNTEVVAVDLRNHGESPHAPEAGYKDLASDVTELVDKEGWKSVNVIGHSMGGKVAMALALSGTIPLSRLVVVDMSPARGSISPEFAAYLTAMQDITKAGVKSRKEADAILQHTEPELSVRQFLLTNLIRDDTDGTYSFRIPLDYLQAALARGEIGDFPYLPIKEGSRRKDIGFGVESGEGDGVSEGRRWNGKAMFLKGSKSKYINRHNEPAIKAFFPNSKVEVLDAGHWVHAEQPAKFLNLVEKFV
ncbi:alpha/beta hydrolase [Pseudohyphozyma bogoriensis]|nr:alpha/beta hydrolase [Pseudohyphozyma bogoriensis]